MCSTAQYGLYVLYSMCYSTSYSIRMHGLSGCSPFAGVPQLVSGQIVPVPKISALGGKERLQRSDL
jgi:hypothetical protein